MNLKSLSQRPPITSIERNFNLHSIQKALINKNPIVRISDGDIDFLIGLKQQVCVIDNETNETLFFANYLYNFNTIELFNLGNEKGQQKGYIYDLNKFYIL
jgi:hypothetical protein